jgi:type IX secretion system PorP/SprF family membrane protein
MMKKVKSLLLLLFLLLVSHRGHAQQEATFAQFMFAHQLLNPAYVGAKSYTNLTALHRDQWVGFEGAPVTQALAVNGRIKGRKLGWGLSVLNDNIGPVVNTSVSLDAAYHLQINEAGHQLAVGVKIGAQNYNIDTSMIQTITPGDAAFVMGDSGELIPNVGFGVYYHHTRFYVGFSIPRLLNSDLYEVSRHAYMICGAIFNLTTDWSIKPSILLKQSEGSPLGYDFSTLLVYSKRFWLGPRLRSALEAPLPDSEFGGSYGLLGGVHLSPNWSVGYAYNTGLGDLSPSFNSGSHEIMIRFDFNVRDLSTLRSPRIF